MDKKPKHKKGKPADYLLGVFPKYDAIKKTGKTLPFRHSIAEEAYLLLLQSDLTKNQINEIRNKIQKQIDSANTAQAIWEAYEVAIQNNYPSGLAVGEALGSSTPKQYLTSQEYSCYIAIFLICVVEVIVQLEAEFDNLKYGYGGDEWPYQKRIHSNNKMAIERVLEDVHRIFQEHLPKDNIRELYAKVDRQKRGSEGGKVKHSNPYNMRAELMLLVKDYLQKYMDNVSSPQFYVQFLVSSFVVISMLAPVAPTQRRAVAC